MSTRILATFIALLLLIGVREETWALTVSSDSPANSVNMETKVPSNGRHDIVRLHNGKSFRGSIVESVSTGIVTIVDFAGKTQKFSLADVDYAGPELEASTDNHANVAPPSAESADASVSFTGNLEKLTIYTTGAKGSSSLYTPLCTTPCNRTIPVGTAITAVGLDQEQPIELRSSFVIEHDTRIHTKYTDKSDIRTALYVSGALAAAIGLGLFVAGSPENQGGYERDWTLEGGGAVLITAGTVMALVPLFIHDSADASAVQ